MKHSRLTVALLTTALWVATLSPAVSAQSLLELKYKAYVAGAVAGKADILLDRNDTNFAIKGRAKAQGLMQTFNPWRADFNAQGRKLSEGWQLDHYHYSERDDRKRREVTVKDGELSVVKNGKLRAVLPALPGIDVLTALFVDSRCLPSLDLHTGRHSYRLVQAGNKKSVPTNNQCVYEATDDDGDQNQVSITFTEVGGRRIPQVIELSGWVSGRLELVRHQVHAPISSVNLAALK